MSSREKLGWIEDIDGRCNCLAVCKAARYLPAAYDKALAPSELRATQFAIPSKLAKHGPMTIKGLATLIAMDRTTLATNLKPLEREGLLAIAPALDRRARNIQITDLGRKATTRPSRFGPVYRPNSRLLTEVRRLPNSAKASERCLAQASSSLPVLPDFH